MSEHAVVIAGAGPTGLMLAAELALAGIDVVVVEPRPDLHVDASRAGGLHARTIEVLDQRGVAGRFLEAGEAMQVQGFAGIPLDIGDFPTRYNHGLALWQSRFEPILAEWVAELDVPIRRGSAITGATQDGAGVDVALSDGGTLRATYLVGCDGGRSVVRATAGIDFVGPDPSTTWLIAEVEMDEPEFGMRFAPAGVQAIGPAADEGLVRVVLAHPHAERAGEPTLDDLRTALVAVYGTDLGLRGANWLSQFTDVARQASTYRRDRVLLAGDAAHVHPPQGGQGLNIGVQDAVNLGWKLAQVAAGVCSASVLDTYHDERHPIGARVLRNTLAQVALSRGDEQTLRLRDTMTELLAMDEPRRRIAGELSGLDVFYDPGPRADGADQHPLVGRRMPDLDLQTVRGTTRVFTLLHDARPVLLDLGAAGSFDLAPWADRVRSVEAIHDGAWELPVIGAVPAPPAVLIRPDGHVAWAGDLRDPELPRSLARWFGPGRPGAN